MTKNEADAFVQVAKYPGVLMGVLYRMFSEGTYLDFPAPGGTSWYNVDQLTGIGYLKFADLELSDLDVWILAQNTPKLGGSVFFLIKEANMDHVLFVVLKLTVKIKYPNPGISWVVHIQFYSVYFIQINGKVFKLWLIF